VHNLTTSPADTIPCKKLYKLAVVGAGGVGKSTLIARIVTGEFLDKTMTVGFDVESWTVQEDDTGCLKVALFDFGGQKQFRFFQGSLIIGSKVALVVFDCCSYRSLMQLDEWIQIINTIPNEHRLLVGTKMDMDKRMDIKEIEEYTTNLDMDYVLVSSKTGENFDLLHNKLQEILRSIDGDEE
jgi:small GTP-binding protein